MPAFTLVPELYKLVARRPPPLTSVTSLTTPSLSPPCHLITRTPACSGPPPFRDDRSPTRTAQPPSAHRRPAAVKPPGHHGPLLQLNYLLLLEGSTWAPWSSQCDLEERLGGDPSGGHRHVQLVDDASLWAIQPRQSLAPRTRRDSEHQWQKCRAGVASPRLQSDLGEFRPCTPISAWN